jgi:hypothetical protein
LAPPESLTVDGQARAVFARTAFSARYSTVAPDAFITPAVTTANPRQAAFSAGSALTDLHIVVAYLSLRRADQYNAVGGAAAAAAAPPAEAALAAVSTFATTAPGPTKTSISRSTVPTVAAKASRLGVDTTATIAAMVSGNEVAHDKRAGNTCQDQSHRRATVVAALAAGAAVTAGTATTAAAAVDAS